MRHALTQRLIHKELDKGLTQVKSYPDFRSLSPASSDATYSSSLSRGQSLIGTIHKAILKHELLKDMQINRANKLHRHMFQHLWKRWWKDYTSHREQRHEGPQPLNKTIVIGSLRSTLRVSKKDNTSPSQWDPGGITQAHPESCCAYAATIMIAIWVIKNYHGHYQNVHYRHRLRNSGLHGHGPAGTQIYMDADPHGRRDIGLQRHRIIRAYTGLHGYRSPRLQAHTGTGLAGYRGPHGTVLQDTGLYQHGGLHKCKDQHGQKRRFRQKEERHILEL